jgi:hypothetical protein
MIIQKLNPAVDKKYLILLAGTMWCGVGVMLMLYAESWLSRYSGSGLIFFYLAGFLTAMPIHHFGFLKLAGKNIGRLLELDHKQGILNFITPKSYLIIIVMVALGITLRHSSLPKEYLSILYNGIGLGLFLSGIRYIRISSMLMMNRKVIFKGKEAS